MRYVAFIHSDEEASFGISFPDFPGCISVGESREEAIRRGTEALAFHIDGMVEDGEPIPPSRSVKAIKADPNLTDWRIGADFALVHIGLDRSITAGGKQPKRQRKTPDGLALR